MSSVDLRDVQYDPIQRPEEGGEGVELNESSLLHITSTSSNMATMDDDESPPQVEEERASLKYQDDMSKTMAVPPPVPSVYNRAPSLSPGKKALYTFCFVAALAGLIGGLATLRTKRTSYGDDMIEPPSFGGNVPARSSVFFSRLSYFNETVLNGYDQCDDLDLDLQEAIEIVGNVTIDHFVSYHFTYNYYWYGIQCRGGGQDCIQMMDDVVAMPEVLMRDPPVMESVDADTDSAPDNKESVADSAPGSAGGEDSFGTNNQVQGVDEADLLKSDGIHVFAAYGDKVMVWNADNGTLLSTTVIPTVDDQGIPLCSDLEDPVTVPESSCLEQMDAWLKNQGLNEFGDALDTEYKGGDPLFDETTGETRDRLEYLLKKFPDFKCSPTCYESYGIYMPFTGWRMPERKPIVISSLMMHGERLIVVASTGYSLTNQETVLGNQKQSRIFVYDISSQAIPTDGKSPLTLLSRKDFLGTYMTARSIGQYAHIVTSSNLNLDSVLRDRLSPWNKQFDGMNETQYKTEAYNILKSISPTLATNLKSELTALVDPDAVGDCSKLSKVALMLKAAKQEGEIAESSRTMLPTFTLNTLLQTLTLVHSFDIAQDVKSVSKTSGVFLPMPSYTSSVYMSTSKLVIAGESYVQNPVDDNWDEHTVLLVFNLENDTSIPESVGDVPGSLLNQFSMDHYFDENTQEDYLRVATTSWGRWGMVGDVWEQVELSESQVTVLKMGNSTGSLEVVGQANGIGMGERIYAVRFQGERAYVVTFRQIDPFYTLNMTDPTDPKVVGELKIPGFSNYLHPIGDDLILALGQNATEEGRQDGLQISLFDVSNFALPTRVKQYTEDASSSTSDAQYEHKAFRYLPDSKLLILPVSVNAYCTEPDFSSKFFDGFVVYDVDETRDFSKKFNISHVGPKDACNFCWSRDEFSPRSLVFDGNVMTLKGHNVLSHVLSDGAFRWELNVDNGVKQEVCYHWWEPPMIF